MTEELGILKGLCYRLDTSDAYTIREMKTYEPLVLDEDDIVLDLGANIGAFAQLRAPHCRRVICIEPEIGNVKVLRANVKSPAGPGVRGERNVVRAAIVANDYEDDEVAFYVNAGKGKTIHSLRPYRGRVIQMVPALRFEDMLALAPGATAMKCDIEGGEHQLPWATLKSSGIRKLAIELHVAMPGQRGDAHRTVDEIAKAGFREIVPHDLRTRMITLGFWER